jgi:cytochrome c peroxidase
LEEVVQRGLDDERDPAPGQRFRHTWGGAIRRVRANLSYKDQFLHVFGTEPTADAVGRALATYLRTLLAGNSVHDRALKVMAGKGRRTPEPEDYEAVLGEAGVLEGLGKPKDVKADVARDLHRGYRLFYNRDGDRRANCVACHGGRQFSDGDFHNLGVGVPSLPGQEQGRFVTVPVGQKNRHLIDAYKTPTLRGLLRTGPYLHDGSGDDLSAVVGHHAIANYHLDPEMRDDKGHVRGDNFKPEEVEALVLFLKALNGDEVDSSLRKPPTTP